ncbi:hypothetical protein TTHERM_000753493 (macronuclear) [Tetrahymena thermophila SB210]|uniref:Transmembrane protein n=1 Tax=Tetrahymena thermophila (strain SB210) TaxID=312017 RepID=W7XBP9_TETTS|nr:hypothetical protein TTHERM_000753493 [Tetrahymena thermophila SB210]EWS73823.1 hypothetical protein TTHERM_000753493 [Tetrahymena thermophila SB210]|eukprot:XP_012653646.1 hypothetical protein TTHERM_000753493 [Tetrahymena thermophila SB210]
MNFKYLLLLVIVLFATASASLEECQSQCDECLKNCKDPGHAMAIDCSSERAKCSAYCSNLGHPSCSPYSFLKKKF